MPCDDCGAEDSSLGPCPYAQEIGGDDTEIWLCERCWRMRADDI